MKDLKDLLIQWIIFIVLLGFILFVFTLAIFYIARMFCFALDIPMNRTYVFVIEGCLILIAAYLMRLISK